MGLSQPSLLSSKILIHTKKLQRNQPILDFPCNTQFKWLKQSHGPLKLKWLIIEFQQYICFYFSNSECVAMESTRAQLRTEIYSLQVGGVRNCSHHAVLPVLLQSWVKLVSTSLCKQIKELYSTGLFFFLFKD